METVPYDLAPLTALSATLGRSPSEVQWYVAWSWNSSFPATQAASVAATGAIPVVTWEPWNPSGGTSQPSYALAKIAGGSWDRYIASWARGIQKYKAPVVIRFAHEMNGDWYPWSEQVNGNKPGDYVAAWRHVRQVFASKGVTNVIWSWSPNVPTTRTTPLAGLYPGDAYVDRVALDGYNFGTAVTASSWQSFSQVFGNGLSQLAALTSKPVYLAEVGCAEAGGDKAAWISDMFAVLAATPQIRGFIWFDINTGVDWRIDSSTASVDAFRAGLATYQ